MTRASRRPRRHPIRMLGETLTAPFRAAGGIGLLLPRALAGLGERGWPRGEVLRQAYSAGNRSMLLVAVTLASFGMVLVFHAGLQAQRVLADMSPVGPAFIQVLLREFGPTIVGLMLAARVGGGIAAEIASMVVTEQVDALRMNAADPVRFLVTPRVLGVWLVTMGLTVFGCTVAVGSGAVTARILFDVPYAGFLSLGMTRPGDLVSGLAKAAAYGAYVPLAAAWAGLGARGGSEGVGRATTTGVVAGSLGVVVLSAIIAALGFALGL